MTGQTAETQTLVESFCALADEVQNLIDRKTILEHKLRFAAEQYQQLADKYAPAAPEISETLSKLQLPTELHRPAQPSTHVPLPRRGPAGCNQHQIALLIRDGRRAAQQLASRTDVHSGSSKVTSSGTAITTQSTTMEQDFTVEGKKKGMLQCPFSNNMKRNQQLQRQREQLAEEDRQRAERRNSFLSQTRPVVGDGATDPMPRPSADPICSALLEEVTSHSASSSGGAVRCPIRFLDQHSPEDIAHYVETHKHELPRSHAICLRRYNQSEEQVRKLDAKYGSLVNMITNLGQLHQPMLPEGEEEEGEAAVAEATGNMEDHVDRVALHRAKNKRVQTWAQGVSVSTEGGGPERLADAADHDHNAAHPEGSRAGASGSDADDALDADETDMERESHFDRPLKEVRLGESPSRPWGISIPMSSLPDVELERPPSPPPAPVHMPAPRSVKGPASAKPQPRKCPFDHTKFAAGGAAAVPPFPHGHDVGAMEAEAADEDEREKASAQPLADQTERPYTPPKPQTPGVVPQLSQTTQLPSTVAYQLPPTFLNLPAVSAAAKEGSATPQMVFTGPVFIGYPIEQAMQFMQHFQNR